MIILLNGSINAGKTTASKALCRLLPQTAHVEVDSLRDFIAWMPLEESIPINIRTALAVTKIFASHGLNVVFSYPLRPEDYEYLACELAALSVPVFCFTLNPGLEIELQNRGTRELTDWERERIKYHFETKLATPEFGETINNAGQTPDETAQEILRRIQSASVETNAAVVKLP